MKDVAFSEPIILQLPGVGPRKVATSFEAIECLENQWPQGARESSWRSAHSVCRDALAQCEVGAAQFSQGGELCRNPPRPAVPQYPLSHPFSVNSNDAATLQGRISGSLGVKEF